jgi:polyhydroxybutyrate depolymerase
MRSFLMFLTLFLGLKGFAADVRDSFQLDGVFRNYIVHLPTSYTTSKNYALVFNLHGYTSNADQQLLYSSMNSTADANEFIVVYPNGIANYWNAFGQGENDVKFIDSLIEKLSRSYTIDKNCVYSCGMSNGGFMSYTLACQLSHKIAAVASVTGVLSNHTINNCTLSHPVPVMQIHGTADPTVNYTTGTANGVGVEQTVNFWLGKNNCTSMSDTIDVPNTNTTDGCTAELIRYQQCDAGSNVYFYKIDGGAHTWPGAPLTIGVTNRDFNANIEIWNFFKRFKLNQLVGINQTLEDLKVEISPIPSTQYLTLKFSEVDNRNIIIYNTLGQEVYSINTNTSTQELNTSGWSKGLYYLNVTDSKGAKFSTSFLKD